MTVTRRVVREEWRQQGNVRKEKENGPVTCLFSGPANVAPVTTVALAGCSQIANFIQYV
jgi:hypothetical protein